MALQDRSNIGTFILVFESNILVTPVFRECESRRPGKKSQIDELPVRDLCDCSLRVRKSTLLPLGPANLNFQTIHRCRAPRESASA